MSLNRIWIPFSSRNYRLYFGGQAISMLGTWMTQTGTIWLVYHLTNSPFWLGAVALLGQLPTILFSPLGGVWVDRLDRLKLLTMTQALAMVQSLLLALFTLADHINIWVITSLAMFQGFINAFDLPTRQSFNILLAEKREHLTAIIAINSSMINTARLIGPAVAGFVIANVGVGWCFFVDGVSYIAVILAIFAMRLPKTHLSPRLNSVWEEMQTGIHYAWSFLPIRALLLMTAACGIFGLSYAVLIPVYAKIVFHGDARTLGLLMSASASGSVIAAVYLAGRKSIHGFGNTIVVGGIIASIALIVFAFSTTLWISLVCLLITGMGGILIFASNNMLIQNLVEESKRGRVMSIYTVAFLGATPVGAMLTGWEADVIGITAATSLNAFAYFTLALIFAWWLPRFRIETQRQIGFLVDPKRRDEIYLK